MLRLFVCAAAGLVLASGVSLAADKGKGKKGMTVQGTIKKVDAAAGTLTISVKKKNAEPMEKDFTVEDATKVNVIAGSGETTEVKGKAGLKNEAFKAGTAVTLTLDADGKVAELRVGKKSKK
jgi:hypothetical protein